MRLSTTLLVGLTITLSATFARAQTTAYVASANEVSATMINTEDFSTDKLVGTGGQRDIAVTRDGKFAYVAVSSLLAVVDIAADTVVTFIDTRARAVALTPDDKFAYVATS
jgi:DNA-binding beta-propeller fold protein YncE